jgi:predicted AlkP superfamily phosphohydrolase/phosphomutase/Flp pilus assembly protein TadD
MSPRLLLIELPAADWKVFHPLIDARQMPAFSRLVDTGASGELLAVQPSVPAMLSTSLMTGKRAWQHGVCHSSELSPDGRRWVPVTAARRRSPALWQMLAHEGKRCLVIGWPATLGEKTKNSTIVSDRFPEPTAGPGIKPWPAAAAGTYWPEDLGKRLDAKRVSPEDIGANVISQYLPDWRKIDQKRDRRIGELRLFLAADYSYQTAALALLKQENWDFAALRFPALAPLSRLFLPHHLLIQSPGKPEEVQLYQHVLHAACRILDEMVRQLLQVAGPETTVMIASGHGVRTQGIPPGGFPPSDPESWKSPYGIFLACGPKFAPDALLHGASILDVAPTVLTWFGLPLGDDMEGRVLIESFVEIPKVTRVDSWEKWMGIPAWPAEENPAASDRPADASLRRESDWNFVQSCLDAGRNAQALPVLDRLFREYPERAEVGHALFQCYLALGKLPEAGDVLEVTLESLPPGIASLLPRAELAVAQRNTNLARSLVGEALKLKSTNPIALRKLGLLLLRLREWDALAQIARQALATNEQEPIAWLGLAAAQLRQGNAAEAAEAAGRAIGLKYFLPDAHFILARALVALGRWPEAREAMQTLLKLQPGNRVAATYFQRMPEPAPPVNEAQ